MDDCNGQDEVRVILVSNGLIFSSEFPALLSIYLILFSRVLQYPLNMFSVFFLLCNVIHLPYLLPSISTLQDITIACTTCLYACVIYV